MRRASLFVVVGSVLLLAFAGMALAAAITCTGGRCEGTNEDDQITGTDQRDRIFALAGADEVEARAGQDELNGGNGSDVLGGETQNDTYYGGKGEDFLTEFVGTTDASNDKMNGGPNRDFLESDEGDDVLKGQGGSEHALGDPQASSMYGDPGDDELYGGQGEDAMEGEEGTDEHYGGDNNDYIDAVDDDFPAGTRDLVDCGSGSDDTAVVREPEDIVRRNCENVIEVMSNTAVSPPSGTNEEEQRRLREAFLQKLGG